jgi:transcriptional regulator with XRE-family HTH domain
MANALPHFAKRLKELREAAGLSKYRLAQLSGLTRQAISNLELGNREPTWVTVQRLARALGVSMEDLADPEIIRPPEPPRRRPGRRRKKA